MLKKMRKRFIIAAMTAFSAVIIGLLCIINIWNYKEVSKRQDEILQTIINLETNNQSSPITPPFPHQGFSSEIGYMIRFFVVTYGANGNVNNIHRDYIASVSEDLAITYANQVLETNRTYGYYEGYRYTVDNIDDETRIIFLNSERELQAIRSLLLLTSIVAGCCLLIVFILVVLLSHRAIAPYVRNIETQKHFITGASHELKTPLTSISTSADVLSLEMGNNEWIQNIQFQSERMSNLIADLITLSRLDEENPYPDKSTFSLSEAVWELSEPYSTIIFATGKEYVQHIEDNINMFGDRSAIQQMISILLDNAQKYSLPNGKIRLDVSKKQHKIEIIVYNTCHIEHYENIEKIFDRFYKLDETYSAKNSYGIGLSIAKSIVENHHGSIHAESQYGNNLLIRIKF